jgi:LysR family transcriptional activator of nhaA
MERLPSVSRRLTIGVSDEIETTFVVEVVSHFLKKHTPETRPRLSMVSASHEQLSERLRFRELDAIISQRPMVDPDLNSLEHIESPVGLFSPKSSRIGKTSPSNTNPLSIQKLVGGPDAQWIKPTLKTKLRAESDLFFEQHEIKGRVVFESDVVASLTRSVADDFGFCLLPLIYVYDAVRDRKIVQIGAKKGYWQYRVWLGCHIQNREDPLVLSFSRSFTDVSKGLL